MQAESSAMQVTEIGENLAVMLPEKVVQDLQLKEGDEVDLIINGESSVSAQPADEKTREEALRRLRARRSSLPDIGYKLDREEANAR
jgi:antitoxin MazE